MKVPCPTCQRETEWSDASPYRPFCSQRCRLIDLGAWLSEEHAIPGDPVEPTPDGTLPTDLRDRESTA
ncbi:MAG: DNA gyrase inhibitor YacG [Steroidobacteraceae bacterium]